MVCDRGDGGREGKVGGRGLVVGRGKAVVGCWERVLVPLPKDFGNGGVNGWRFVIGEEPVIPGKNAAVRMEELLFPRGEGVGCGAANDRGERLGVRKSSTIGPKGA